MALNLAADALKTVPPEIPKHAQLEDKLGKYCGLVLYMKEMDEERYQKLCAVSLSRSSSQAIVDLALPHRIILVPCRISTLRRLWDILALLRQNSSARPMRISRTVVSQAEDAESSATYRYIFSIRRHASKSSQ